MALVAFDFDGTLSDDEMIVLLGERVGRADEIRDVTERAMDGELSYAESLRERVTMLEGPTAEEAAATYERVELREGAAAVLRALTGAGVRVVILTGGFESGVEHVLDRAGVGVDRVVANRLVVDADGRLTGEVAGPLVDGTKDEALRAAAESFGIGLDETVAVGDGANDVPMLDAAGTAIGFRPKPAVVDHCDVVVESMPELHEALADLGLVDRVGA